jgi:hypothetical protein
MAKLVRMINGVPRSVTIDQEVSISNAATNVVVTFPAALQTASSTPRVVAWMVNTTDSNPQFQTVEITARSSTGFTATWNAPVDSANYKLAYNVPDGFVT